MKSTDSAGFELGVLARPWIWWKCFVVAERVVNEICSDEHGLDIEERKEILERVLGDDKMHILLPEYAKNKRLTILN